MILSRRQLLASGAALALAPRAAWAAPANSLDATAQTKGRRFGTAVGMGQFPDPRYRALIEAECGVIVPENELKMRAIHPNGPDEFDFAKADILVDYATSYDLKIRGHNLIWHHPDWMPKWSETLDYGPKPAERVAQILSKHVDTVCRRYADRIFTWDVVNEAIDPETGRMRDMVFSRHLGDDCMDIVFDAARKAAPQAALVYNDFMTWGDNSARHREGVLKLLDRMKSRKVPVDVLGVQSHIGAGESGNVKGTMTFDAREEADWKSFMDAATALYPRLQITEFDVSEVGTPADIPARDRIIADLARRYLDMMLRYPGLDHVMCWGMLDHHSWLQSRTRRADGMMKRGCPYDANYQPKPLRQAIADAFRNAPPRA